MLLLVNMEKEEKTEKTEIGLQNQIQNLIRQSKFYTEGAVLWIGIQVILRNTCIFRKLVEFTKLN